MIPSDRQRQFEAYLSGKLSPAEAEALEASMLADDELLAQFEAFSTGGAVPSEELDVVPPSDFTHSVRERIRRRSGGRFFQEDRVTARYIPIFSILAFVLLAAFAIAGRMTSVKSLTTEELEVVDQGDLPAASGDANSAQERSSSRLDRGRRISDRPYRAQLDEEQQLMPASASIPYQQLPVSGGQTPASVTYTQRVVLLESPKSAADLRAEIEEKFGQRTLEEEDGYFRMQLRDRDFQGALQRLGTMSGVVKQESRTVSLEETESTYVRFYFDMPATQR